MAPVAWKAFGVPPSKKLKVRQLSDILFSAVPRPKLAITCPVGTLHWAIKYKSEMGCEALTVNDRLGLGEKGKGNKGK